MQPNPRKPGRFYHAAFAEQPHPDPQHIFLTSRAVIRLASEGAVFDDILNVFSKTDNAGLRHIAECDVCIDALKNRLSEPQETPEV